MAPKTRADVASGKGVSSGTKRTVPVEVKNETSLRKVTVPNMKRVCSVVLFFLGSFSIGFGAGFGAGFGVKECA